MQTLTRRAKLVLWIISKYHEDGELYTERHNFLSPTLVLLTHCQPVPCQTPRVVTIRGCSTLACCCKADKASVLFPVLEFVVVITSGFDLSLTRSLSLPAAVVASRQKGCRFA